MDPYIGEIRLFSGKFAPLGWAICDGSMMQVQQNQALFNVIGNRFGGNGVTTFALPDLRGRAVMHQGTGTGLTPRQFASIGGEVAVSLTTYQLPTHSHMAGCQSVSNSQSPKDGIWGSGPARPIPRQLYAPAPDETLHPLSLNTAGGSMPHNNMQPYLALNYIIALEGVFPVKPS